MTNWDHQVKLFEEAIQKSPTGLVDIVVANAGISGQDPVFVDDCTLILYLWSALSSKPSDRLLTIHPLSIGIETTKARSENSPDQPHWSYLHNKTGALPLQKAV